MEKRYALECRVSNTGKREMTAEKRAFEQKVDNEVEREDDACLG